MINGAIASRLHQALVIAGADLGQILQQEHDIVGTIGGSIDS
jgi:hypothetical protein